MIPPHSCAVPGRKPGTSTKVTSGMLNASHVRTNRAAFTDASMSSTPASAPGWLPTTPAACPPRRAKPQTMFSAQCACTSRNSPSSTTRSMTPLMSYGLWGVSGGGGWGAKIARPPRGGLLGGGGEMGPARLGGVRRRAAELLERDVLACHGLHDVGACDEHVRSLLDHEH